jgi:hypothetical protein
MRTIRPWGRIFRKQPHGLRELYLAIGLPYCKVTMRLYFPLVRFRKPNTRLNFLYTEVLLVIAIGLTLAFGS